MDSKDSRYQKVSAAGILIAMGIIYGDIGTSPLYTLRFIVGDHVITEDLIFGGLSCVFWTLTLITTIKYVYLALNADNKGEGGIFALYALVRRYKAQWVIFPAIIGCCTLIADGFITPAISVTSAIEGLRSLNPDITNKQSSP
jgi:KUP system potassium uptake protein